MEIMEVELRVLQELFQMDLLRKLELNAKVSLKGNPRAWLKVNKITREALTLGLMTAHLIES